MRWLILALTFSGCVGKKKYDAAVAERDAKVASCESNLAASQKKATDLENEKAALLHDQSQLNASIEEMQRAMAEADARKIATEARLEEYRMLLGKFKKLIDAGKLKVKIVDGRMVVELATDVLFDSGSAKLSDAGKAAIVEVSQVLATIGERSFQVEGHTDNVPIATAQYPSNWELAAGRALTVMKTMIESGMPAARISAASYGDQRPVKSNDTAEGKAANRRIEIVLVPDLSGLPGFDELIKASGNTPAP